MQRRLINTLLSALFLPVAVLAQATAPAAKAAAPAAAKAAAPPALAPLSINPPHDGDTKITGTSPLAKIALTMKINGLASSPQNADDKGAFTFNVSTPVRSGNFIEISGTAGGSTVSGSVEVQPAALGKPSITSPKVTDTIVVVTRNSADSQPGLTIVVSPVKANTPNFCTPDDTTAMCQVTVDPLTAGETIKAYESLNGASGPDAIATLAVSPLAAPVVSTINEGDKSVTVTAAKSDLARSGLVVNVTVKSASSGTKSCPPDTTSGVCTVQLESSLTTDNTVEASEKSNDNPQGAIVDARVTPLAAFGKPTINPINEGDDTVTVTLNSSDKQAGLSIRVMLCNRNHGLAECLPAGQIITSSKPCAPADATGSCPVKLDVPVLEGDTVQAWESYKEVLRPIDGVATATVGARAVLNIPIISPMKESDTSVKISVDPNDIQKWGTSLTVHLSVYSGGSAISNKTCSPASGQDNCTVSLDSALIAGEVLHANVTAAPAATTPGSAPAPMPSLPGKPGPEVVLSVPELGFDWGRVRAYFSLGAVFSRSTTTTASTTAAASTTETNFSSPDVFAGLDMDFNWYSSQRCLAYPFGNDHVRIATIADAASQCNNHGTGRAAKYRSQSKPATHPAGVPDAKGVTDVPGVPDLNCVQQSGNNRAMAYTSDRSLLTSLELLYCLDSGAPSTTSRHTVPERLNSLKTLLTCSAARLDAVEVIDNPVNATEHGGDCNMSPAPTPKSASDYDSKHQFELREAQAKMAEAFNQLSTIELTPREAQEVLQQFGYEKTPQRGWMINSYALTRLTQTQASNGFSMSTSPNSIHVEGGAYLPIYTAFSRWPYKGNPYALFIAPIAKMGFDSLRLSGTDPIFVTTTAATPSPSDANYQNAVTALSKDVYRMMAFGGRLGLFQLSSQPNRAPESIMNIDFTYGRYDNFFVQQYSQSPATPTGGVRFPWRLGMNSRLEIPGTIFYIGSDMTKGVGPDSFSIYVGARADLSALLSKLIPTTQQ